MSGFSKIEIANGALSHCGEASISSLTQEGKAARILNRQYDLVRKRVISKYRWNFSKKRETLAADPTAPNSGFLYRHRHPSDLISLIGIADEAEDQRNYTASSVVFKNEGGFILSDTTPLSIIYTADIEDTSQFDASFVAVLEYYLATKIYYDLTKGTERYSALVQEREKAVKEARFAHAMENTPEVIVASDWLDSRFYDGGSNRFRDNNSI
jgi:hypothetical protein